MVAAAPKVAQKPVAEPVAFPSPIEAAQACRSKSGEVQTTVQQESIEQKVVSYGQLLAALAAVFLTILVTFGGMAMSNAADKATLTERVAQNHSADVSAYQELREEQKNQAAENKALRDQMTANHLEIMMSQTKTQQSVADLYQILKADTKGR